jgi:SAM-dependent methyltransferase
VSAIFSADEFEAVPCPICSGHQFTALAGEDRYLMGMKTVGCNGCGLVLTNPQPTDAALGRFYRDHYRRFYQKVAVPDLKYIAAYKKDERSANTALFLKKQGKLLANSRVLDIGAAEGSMLKAIADLFPDAVRVAVEPNPDFGCFAVSYAGCDLFPEIDDVAGQKFDLVILNHVLEHVKDPVPFLKKIGALLAPGGSFYIDVPSVAGYDGLHDFHVAHIYHFGQVSLSNLVARAGFSVSLLQTHEPVMHPRSLRMLCHVSDAGVINISEDVREGWDACRQAGREAWRYRLRATTLWRLLSRLKQFLKAGG